MWTRSRKPRWEPSDPLARHEFDGSHRGLCHTLGEMTIVCGKCNALHFLRSVLHQVPVPIWSLLYAARKVKWRCPRWHPHQSRLGGSLQVTKWMQKTFVNTSVLTTMRWPSRLWGPTWIPVLPNLAIILTVFAVSFTIGWGVYFLNLARHQNSPNCTSTIRMPSLMVELAILAT